VQAAHPHPELTVRVKKYNPDHVRKPAKAATSPHNWPAASAAMAENGSGRCSPSSRPQGRHPRLVPISAPHGADGRPAPAMTCSGQRTTPQSHGSRKKKAAPQQAAVSAEAKQAAINADVVRAIRVAERKAKADPAVLMGIAWQESRFDPLARNKQSSARGLLQFTAVTWLTVIRDFGARHGLARYAAAIKTGQDGSLTVEPHALRRKILALRDNPELAAIMAAERLAQERGVLEERLGRPAKPADLYVLHLLGPTGAREFLTELARNPDKPSVDVVRQVATPNRGLFVRDGHVLTVADTYNMIVQAATQPFPMPEAVVSHAAAATPDCCTRRSRHPATRPAVTPVRVHDRTAPGRDGRKSGHLHPKR